VDDLQWQNRFAFHNWLVRKVRWPVSLQCVAVGGRGRRMLGCYFFCIFVIGALTVSSRGQEFVKRGTNSGAKLGLKMVIVPEVQACQPSGYAPDQRRSNCRPLTVAEVRGWIERKRYPHSQYEIRGAGETDDAPFPLVLTEMELELLASYSGRKGECRRSKSSRPSI
jgi:hypothetical protein